MSDLMSKSLVDVNNNNSDFKGRKNPKKCQKGKEHVETRLTRSKRKASGGSLVNPRKFYPCLICGEKKHMDYSPHQLKNHYRYILKSTYLHTCEVIKLCNYPDQKLSHCSDQLLCNLDEILCLKNAGKSRNLFSALCLCVNYVLNVKWVKNDSNSLPNGAYLNDFFLFICFFFFLVCITEISVLDTL